MGNAEWFDNFHNLISKDITLQITNTSESQ